MLATTGARALLKVAISDREEAAEIEGIAARAVVRAKAMVDDAEKTLAALAGVEEEIAARKADDIRAWASNGGERPTGGLPQHLAAKRELKIDAETKVTEARSTHELLSKELLAACGRLQDRNTAVQRAAAAVLSSEAEPIIDELRQARQLVWSLEDKLRSLGTVLNNVRRAEVGRSSGSGLAHLTLPPISFAAVLNETARPMLASNVSTPYAIATEKWEAYLQALILDPSSTLESLAV